MGAARCTLHALRLEDLDERAQDRRLPGAGPAGQDRELVGERVSERGPLQLVELEARPLLRPLDRGVDLEGGSPLAARESLATTSAILRSARSSAGELDEPGPAAAPRAASAQWRTSCAGGDERLDPGGDELRARSRASARRSPLSRASSQAVCPSSWSVSIAKRIPASSLGGASFAKPEVDRDPVGRLEADPLDLARHPVGLGGEDRLGLRAVLPDELDALAGADPVGLQEDVQLALRALAVPGLLDRGGALAPDARDVAQPARLLAQDAERVGAEGVDDLVRVHPAYPRHEPAAEVLADAVDARGQLALEGGDLELGAVLGVAGPFAGEVERLAALDARERAHDRDRLGLRRPPRPRRAGTRRWCSGSPR